VSLADLAAVAGLSPNQFCTAFRITMGEPPHRWLVRRRIERARDLLADPRLTITDVALSVGFGSSAQIATAFRKNVGATPSAYRRGRLP
jgi:AraC family transcriptional regulator